MLAFVVGCIVAAIASLCTWGGIALIGHGSSSAFDMGLGVIVFPWLVAVVSPFHANVKSRQIEMYFIGMAVFIVVLGIWAYV